MSLHLQKTPTTNNRITGAESICCYQFKNSKKFGEFSVRLIDENFAKNKNAFHFELTRIKAANLTLSKAQKGTLMFTYYKYPPNSEA